MVVINRNVQEFSKAKDGDKNISKNFKIKEFACQDGSDKILIDLDMIPVLQTIRDVGGRVTINSAYRTPTHNKNVGGASRSFHLYGRAFDIVSERLSTTDVCNLANSLGVKGIIKYPTFVHIDSRIDKYHADNNGKYLTYGKYEQTALDYLVSKGRITDVIYWQNRLSSVKWLIIKWAADVAKLEANNIQ